MNLSCKLSLHRCFCPPCPNLQILVSLQHAIDDPEKPSDSRQTRTDTAKRIKSANRPDLQGKNRQNDGHQDSTAARRRYLRAD